MMNKIVRIHIPLRSKGLLTIKINLNDSIMTVKIIAGISPLNQLFTLCGSKQIQVNEIQAGDIGCVNKVEGLDTSMTLCDPKNKVTYKELNSQLQFTIRA